MSVQSEIDRIYNKIQESYAAIADKGGTLPSVRKSNGLYQAINSIPASAASVTVNLVSGATVTATKGTRTVNFTWNGAAYVGSLDEYGEWTITATKGSDTTQKTIDVEEATSYTVSMSFGFTITISGNGGSSTATSAGTYYTYVKINGTAYTTAGSIKVAKGTTVEVYGKSAHSSALFLPKWVYIGFKLDGVATGATADSSSDTSFKLLYAFTADADYNINLITGTPGSSTTTLYVEAESIAPPSIYPKWSEATDAELLEIVGKLDSGEITTSDLNWKIGDARIVHLNAMSATGVGESHAAQDVQFVLMDSTLTGMTPADSSKPLHFAVGMKDCLNEQGYINSSSSNKNGWDGSARRAWCNNVFANSLPSDFRACFRQFKWKLGKGGGASSGLTESIDIFALPNEKQAFGTAKKSQSDEADLYNHWQWYMTEDNRTKKVSGSNDSWWESSAVSGSSGAFCYAYSKTQSSSSSSNLNEGISPFGCI